MRARKCITVDKWVQKNVNKVICEKEVRDQDVHVRKKKVRDQDDPREKRGGAKKGQPTKVLLQKMNQLRMSYKRKDGNS